MKFDKIIINPPYNVFSKHRKLSSKMILEHCDFYVVLATFKYCNNTMGNVEFLGPDAWHGIQSPLGLSYTGNTNHEEKPEFLEPVETGGVTVKNTLNFWDYRRREYKNVDLLFCLTKEDGTPCKSTSTYDTTEEFIREHWDQIWLDSFKWRALRECGILINKKL